MEMAGGKFGDSITELRQTFRSGRTRSFAWRQDQLQAILELMNEKEQECFQALHQDLGKSNLDAYKDEIGLIKKSTDYVLNHLKDWMAPKKAGIPLLFFPAKGEIMPEPYGLVLIISAWNFPINLTFEPLLGAIAAGNTVIIKPSELAPACSSFLANTIPQYLDSKAIKVVEGGVDISEQLLQQKWDKIFFTGSPRVGRIIMSEAAKHLTPVTLELGGKCPTIFDFRTMSSNLKAAIRRVASGKWGSCVGQACLAVDYLLVEEKSASSLIDLLKRTIKHFYGENSRGTCRVANKCHYNRLCCLLKDPRVADSIILGGSVDEENLYIEPTVLLNPPRDAEVMTDEIFGPILPIITLNNIQESIEIINSMPKPLAIYAFTEDEALKNRILTETSSGSVIFNDVVINFLCDELP
ncbi:Aldehyde dehydrogenase 3 member F1, partial [Ancistrocladus abbreviatus]